MDFFNSETVNLIRKWLHILLTIIVLIIVVFILFKSPEETKIIQKEEIKYKEPTVEVKEITPDSQKIYVDIKGAVTNPGVYEVTSDMIVNDQTCPIMIQRLSTIFQRNPLISMGI